MGFGAIQLTTIDAKEALDDEILASSVIPFYWMILLIGGLIVLTLAYVSFRKYRGQKRKKTRRK